VKLFETGIGCPKITGREIDFDKAFSYGWVIEQPMAAGYTGLVKYFESYDIDTYVPYEGVNAMDAFGVVTSEEMMTTCDCSLIEGGEEDGWCQDFPNGFFDLICSEILKEDIECYPWWWLIGAGVGGAVIGMLLVRKKS